MCRTVLPNSRMVIPTSQQELGLLTHASLFVCWYRTRIDGLAIGSLRQELAVSLQSVVLFQALTKMRRQASTFVFWLSLKRLPTLVQSQQPLSLAKVSSHFPASNLAD